MFSELSREFVELFTVSSLITLVILTTLGLKFFARGMLSVSAIL